jgi:ABC-type transporter Mla MlaB component
LALDLAAIESCDTAGAQLLVSARRAATVAGKPFACLRVPACVTEAWTLLGLPMDLISSQSN